MSTDETHEVAGLERAPSGAGECGEMACKVTAAHNPHYDQSYFEWQGSGGELVPNLERWKFAPFVRNSDVALDFGCGDGRILAGLQCRKRYGVEVNAIARVEAARVINVYADIDEIPSDILFDVIISHHALEHVDHPLLQLGRIRARLNRNGKVVLVVPSELWLKQRAYRSSDINQHLYTWTPQSLGNLFTRAGFVVERVEMLRHRLLPRTLTVYRMVPKRLFHYCCNAWGMLTRTRQIRIVATKGSEMDSGPSCGVVCR